MFCDMSTDLQGYCSTCEFVFVVRYIVRHSFSCEAVFSALKPGQGCFLYSYRDPRIGFSVAMGSFDFGIFFVFFSKSFFGGFGGQHGPNMVPTWGPRGFPNREKSVKKGDHILDVVLH